VLAPLTIDVDRPLSNSQTNKSPFGSGPLYFLQHGTTYKCCRILCTLYKVNFRLSAFPFLEREAESSVRERVRTFLGSHAWRYVIALKVYDGLQQNHAFMSQYVGTPCFSAGWRAQVCRIMQLSCTSTIQPIPVAQVNSSDALPTLNLLAESRQTHFSSKSGLHQLMVLWRDGSYSWWTSFANLNSSTVKSHYIKSQGWLLY
jgi:hypothetical protein